MDGFQSFQTGLPSLDDVQARIDSQQEVLSSVVGDVFAPLDSAMNYQQGIMDKLNGRIKRQINGRLNAQHEMLQGVTGVIANAVDTRIGGQQHQLAAIEGGIHAARPMAKEGRHHLPFIIDPIGPPTSPPPPSPPHVPLGYITDPVSGLPTASSGTSPPNDALPFVTDPVSGLPAYSATPPSVGDTLPSIVDQPGTGTGVTWQHYVNRQTGDVAAFVADASTGTSPVAIGSGYSGPVGPAFTSLDSAQRWLDVPGNRSAVASASAGRAAAQGVRRSGPIGPATYLPPPSAPKVGPAPPANANGPFGVFGNCASSTLQVVNLSDIVSVKKMLASGWANAGGSYPSALAAQSAAAKMTPSWFDANCRKADLGGTGSGIATIGSGAPTDGGGLVWMIACNPILQLLNVFDVTSQPGLLTGGDTAGWRIALPNQFSTWKEGNDYLQQPGVAAAAWSGCGSGVTLPILPPTVPPVGPPIGTPPPPNGCPPIPPCPPPGPCPPCPPCPITDGQPPPCPCPDWDDLLHKLCKCLQSMSLSAPVDLDQPLAFIFGEAGQAWRDAAIQWHGEGLQAVIDSPSVAEMVRSRPEGRSMKYNG